MRIIQRGEFTKIILNSFVCLFPIIIISLQWCAQVFSLLSMFDCFKYHQPLLGLHSTALVQGWQIFLSGVIIVGDGECWLVMNVGWW